VRARMRHCWSFRGLLSDAPKLRSIWASRRTVLMNIAIPIAIFFSKCLIRSVHSLSLFYFLCLRTHAHTHTRMHSLLLHFLFSFLFRLLASLTLSHCFTLRFPPYSFISVAIFPYLFSFFCLFLFYLLYPLRSSLSSLSLSSLFSSQ